MNNTKFKVLATQSSIDWEGRKITGAHNGTIELKDGTLILNNGQLAAGEFVVDTTSIKVLDISDPALNAQMAGHLASADFFSSDQFPEAHFVIKAATSLEGNTYKIGGDLTIKGITHPNSFIAHLNGNNDTLTATGKIKVDRTLYDMKFRSGNFFQNLGDTLIYNEFDLIVHITAQAA